MTDWIIVILDLAAIIFSGAIALWFASDLADKRMLSFAVGFILIAIGVLFFALPRDFILAIYAGVPDNWFMSRAWSILPWRVLLAVGLGIIAIILRFGDWTPGSNGR